MSGKFCRIHNSTIHWQSFRPPCLPGSHASDGVTSTLLNGVHNQSNQHIR